MPIKKCTNKEGKSGYSWGNGPCITGPGAKKKVIKMAIKIEGPKEFSRIMKEESHGENQEGEGEDYYNEGMTILYEMYRNK